MAENGENPGVRSTTKLQKSGRCVFFLRVPKTFRVGSSIGEHVTLPLLTEKPKENDRLARCTFLKSKWARGEGPDSDIAIARTLKNEAPGRD
jgi:hypothetical protein